MGSEILVLAYLVTVNVLVLTIVWLVWQLEGRRPRGRGGSSG